MLLQTEQDLIRLAIFLLFLIGMSCLEAVWPQRKRLLTRYHRWLSNLSLSVINSLILRLLGPISTVAVANLALDNSWGLLANMPVPMPLWLELALALLLLDIAIYFQHRLFHRVPVLWRMHRIHHADRDVDVSTAVRFHPLEAIFSLIYKCGIVLLLGALPMAVLLFEVLLNASAMFHHANIRLPGPVDRLLRLLIISPDMHRIHHSSHPSESNSNYGFFLSVWDRVFASYVAEPASGQDGMTLGLAQYQSEQPASLRWILTNPFSRS